jgi:pimeloyl-ACP methyl ester carboxylesterase
MAQGSRQYVLVHGASHGGWCWDEVAARLRRRGHLVLAPDLPGHGRRAGEAAGASVAAYAQAVADAMAQAGVHRGILVGHSMGGVVIPKAAERAPGRVRHLVFLAAVVLQDGERLLDAVSPAARALVAAMAAGRGDGTFLYPAEVAWARWLGDMPRDDPRTAAALARLTPQPLRPWREPVAMRAYHALGLPATYVRCLRDAAVLPAMAARFAARLGVRPVDLDTAHGPMLSAPDALVRILEAVPA